MDLYDFIRSEFYNYGGTRLINALVRNGIKSLEKFENTPLDTLVKLKGIGPSGRDKIRKLKYKLEKMRTEEKTERLYKDFLNLTGIDKEKIERYFLELDFGDYITLGIDLKNGDMISYSRPRKNKEAK